MNKIWIEASHESRIHSGPKDNPNLKIVRVLDAVGLFETSWLIYNHVNNRYGYPNTRDF